MTVLVTRSAHIRPIFKLIQISSTPEMEGSLTISFLCISIDLFYSFVLISITLILLNALVIILFSFKPPTNS